MMARPTVAALLLLAAVPGTARAQSGSAIVRPGMTDAQVRAAWGAPAGTRTRGAYTYLFFRRDCQPGCGDPDLVMLERGQVVDAITRSPSRPYDGVSSSPATRPPGFTGHVATPSPKVTP
jgi:hypothetical protein